MADLDDVFNFPIAGQPGRRLNDEAAAKSSRRRKRSRPAALDVVDDAEAAVARALPDVFDFPVAGKRAEKDDDELPEVPGPKPTPGRDEKPDVPRTDPSLAGELGKSLESFGQGATLNWMDEILATANHAYGAAKDWASGTHHNGSWEEKREMYDALIKPSTRDYPVAHGAGQAATGLVASAAVPGGIAAQSLVQGAQSGLSSYGDVSKWEDGKTGWGIGLDTAGGLASGAAGAGLGRWAANRWGVVDPMKNKLVRGAMSAEDMARAPDLPITARGGRPTEVYHTLETVDPLESNLVRGPQPMEGLGMRGPAPQGAPPRAPLERIEGMPHGPAAYEPPPITPDAPMAIPGMDPPVRPAGAPAGPMRAGAPTAPAGGGDDLESLLEASVQAPKVVRRGGRFAKPEYTFGELDLAPTAALPRPPTEAPYRAGQYLEHAALDALDTPGAAAPRFGPELPREEVLRGGARMFDPDVAPLDVPAAIRPSVRPGAVEARRAAMGPADAIEIGGPKWDVATSAQRAAGTPKGSLIDDALRVGRHVPGLGMWSRAGQMARTALGSGEKAAAEAGVYLNESARRSAIVGNELVDELLPPALLNRKVNAQEGDFTAYADAPSLNYALSATLSRGDTGLSPEDEQALTSAVVRGDQQAINAADFRLRQRYPAYARRVERELRAANEGE